MRVPSSSLRKKNAARLGNLSGSINAAKKFRPSAWLRRRFQKLKNSSRRYPELRDKRIVIFLGRLHPKKGCDLLIDAFRRSVA